jgi:hypothetical protein
VQANPKEAGVDRKSLERMKFDRRLIRRRNWISSDDLRRELDSLPDVAEKAAPIEMDEAESEEEPTASP